MDVNANNNTRRASVPDGPYALKGALQDRGWPVAKLAQRWNVSRTVVYQAIGTSRQVLPFDLTSRRRDIAVLLGVSWKALSERMHRWWGEEAAA